MVSIPACHAGDRGSIPRRGVFFYSNHMYTQWLYCTAESSPPIFTKINSYTLVTGVFRVPRGGTEVRT